MIGFMKAVFWFGLVCLAFGTVMAFYTSWRDGCLGRDIQQSKRGLGGVYLRIKNFAQHRLGDLAVNLVLAVLLVIAMLMVLQFSLNLYHGVY